MNRLWSRITPTSVVFRLPPELQSSDHTSLSLTEMNPPGFFSAMEVLTVAGVDHLLLTVSRRFHDSGHHAFAGRLVTPGGVRPFAGTYRFRAELLSRKQLMPITNKLGTGDLVVSAVAATVRPKPRLRLAKWVDAIPRGKIPVVWGVLDYSGRVIKLSSLSAGSWIHFDHAYFHRGHRSGSYRLSINGLAAGPVRECPEDRALAHRDLLLPWRRSGDHILVCPPSNAMQRFHGCSGWLEHTLDELARHTDRPIRVRQKPKKGHPYNSFLEDLAGAHALVTHASNAAVEAVAQGIPVFVDDASPAAPVGLSDLGLIETPLLPERWPWFKHLFQSQFSLEEIGSGDAIAEAFRHLSREALPHPAGAPPAGRTVLSCSGSLSVGQMPSGPG